MAVTSPDNIWTPDSGDDYALTVDLARTADDVQDALNTVRNERVPRLGSTVGRARAAANYYSQYTQGGAILSPNTEASADIATLSGTFPAGSVATIFTSLQLAQVAGVTIAGNIRVRLGGTLSSPVIAERRWNNHGRGGMLFPSLGFSYVFTSDVVNPQFTIGINSDPLSGGGIELWDGQLSIVIDRIG